MNVKELGQQIKAECPGVYDHLSDEEVGRRVKAKHPEYAHVTDVTSLEKRQNSVDQLVNYYNPKRGRFSSWWSRGKAESRVKLLKVLNEEQALVIEQGAMLEKEILRGRRDEVSFRSFVAKHAAELHEIRTRAALIDQALDEGYTLDNHQQKKLATDLTELRLQEAQQLSKLKITEHQELKTIDLDVRWKEIVQDLDAADLLEISEQQVIKKLTGYLAEMLRERHQIEMGDDPEPVKQELLGQYSENIRNLKERINARQRLVLSENGQETKRLEAGSPEGRGYSQEEDQTNANSLQAQKRRPGRPRGSTNKRGGEG